MSIVLVGCIYIRLYPGWSMFDCFIPQRHNTLLAFLEIQVVVTTSGLSIMYIFYLFRRSHPEPLSLVGMILACRLYSRTHI